MAARALNLFAPQEQQPNTFATEDDITRRRMMAKALAEAAAAQRVDHPTQGLNMLAQGALSGLEDRKASRDEQTRRQALAQALGGMQGGDALNPESMATIYALDPNLGLNLQQQQYQRQQAEAAAAAAAADRAQQQANADRSYQLQRDQFQHQTSQPLSVGPKETLLDPNTREPIYTPPNAGVEPPNFGDVGGLRDEIRSLPSYKNFQQAVPLFISMADTAGRDTKASDLNLVYGLGKIMDPTSVVREGEMVMVRNASSLPDWLIGEINGLNGGATLTPETRKAIMAEAASRMQAYRTQLDNDLSQYGGMAERYNLNPQDILPPMPDLPAWPPQEAAQPGAAAQEQAAPAPPAPPQPEMAAPPPPPQPGAIMPGDDGRQWRFKGGEPGDPANWEPVQ